MILGIIKTALGIWIGYGIAKFIIAPYLDKRKKKKEKSDEFLRGLRESLREGMKNFIEENKKLQGNEIPSDADILLYYKMYCKRMELKALDIWTTEKPCDFEVWEKRAKDIESNYGGWRFMISRTCDSVIYDSRTNQTTFMSHHNYRKLVEEDDKALIKSLEETADELHTG
jgi:hypothetical protein